jgi:signal transduction histidine kinase
VEELVRRSLDRWQRAQRPGATPAEVQEALEVVPELCAALDASARLAAGTPASAEGGPGPEALRFARHLSHEIRNRLHLVEMSLERASLHYADAGFSSALDPVRKAVGHLAGITEELRTAFDPAPAAGAPLGRKPLRAVVEDALEMSRGMAEDGGVALEVDGELPEVEVDAARLELILINLLNNALRHADATKGERWVRIECRRLDGEAACRIGVVDNGSGIPEERRDGLFEEPGPDGDGSPPLSGMGLAIVRQAVERSGGRVWIESEEGAGTSVYFTLPAPGAAEGPATTRPPAAR